MGSDLTFGYYDDFHKSQITQIAKGTCFHPQSQPTIHVGVMPYKLASAKNLVTDTEVYTDMQTYFEIEASCTVVFSFPTRYPHAQVPNVHPANQILFHSLLKSMNNLHLSVDLIVIELLLHLPAKLSHLRVAEKKL
ncbi:hypothetical protein JTE90_003076 [Oedothorax gibbosus]|uniref:Uncharacterized protein n=1 Tax=Oedothorax gibbosus TaxID=931172 RepID=A0AAV6TQW1_9ARAC|nr:hypothetical protein JTE90_003076 [Oedothorax gibbosus]